MDVVVCCKLVPDLVEELEVNEAGTDLDWAAVRWVLNEFDDHALEEAFLLKESTGARVTVLVPEADGAEEVLYTALAKGADRAIRLTGLPPGAGSRALAAAFSQVLPSVGYDVILTGVQAVDDVDGQVGGLLSGMLGLPYVGVVTGVEVDWQARRAVVRKEYAGGVVEELEVDLPAVLGVQSARKPPRYAPVSRVRQLMREGKAEALPAELPAVPRAAVRRVFRPQTDRRAQILQGPAEQAAAQLVAILEERGLLRR